MTALTRSRAAQKTNGRSKLQYRWYVPYLFLLPGLILYVVWTVYPLAYQLYISFFDWRIMPGQVSKFIGLANYQKAFADPIYRMALGNTVTYAIITVIGQMILGLAIAVLVYRVVIGKRVFRAIYYLPVVTSWVVVSFLFQYLFSSSASGLVNFFLLDVLHVISKPISWMTKADTAWVVI